jgi:glucose/arabinose dehydrogenase
VGAFHFGGSPLNPCGDPPVPAGGTQAPPTAEGGALRSQSLERAPGEPVSLSGSILRVDPAGGFAPLDNPLAGNPDANAARIVAEAFRNPFRFTVRPGTNEVWAGDVGWNTWEEIDRLPAPAGPFASNVGWPCYEGAGQMASYRSANLNVCNVVASGGSSP